MRYTPRRRYPGRTILFLVLLAGVFASCGRTTVIQQHGAYIVELKEHAFGRLICQPREEFSFLGQVSTGSKQYLGTCGTPGYVTESLHMRADHSCYAVASDGSSMVYFHNPEFCGAGEIARRKRGGVYLHTAKDGDRLLYDDSQVSQAWGGRPLDGPALRVAWTSATPSKTGAHRGQLIVISPSGEEMIEGKASSSSAGVPTVDKQP